MLAEALDRAENGMDFADALHLGAAARCESMLTFDRRFVELAKDSPLPVTEPSHVIVRGPHSESR